MNKALGVGDPNGTPDITYAVDGNAVPASSNEFTFGCFVTAYQHVSPATVLTLPTARVVYRGQDGHIQEISLAPGAAWSAGDLTALAGAPPAAGDPTGYVTPLDHTARVVYRGQDGHIQEISLAPGAAWSAGDLTALAGAPPAAGDPTGYTG